MSRPSIALFFTKGVSLETWRTGGMYSREVGYYRDLEREFGRVLFITYDRRPDSSTAPIEVAHNRWRISDGLFSVFAPLLLRNDLRRCSILKTNQIRGSWTAVLAKRLLRKPLVVRCGFVQSQFAAWEGVSPLRQRWIDFVERVAVRAGDLVFVATEADRDFLSSKHGVPSDRFRHVPTPIDTDIFKPVRDSRDPRHVVFVGRLAKQKKLPLLIEAINSIDDVRLTLIGDGPLEAELRGLADPAKVTFAGKVANDEIPSRLASASVFVLPSAYEGSPKGLLEAMACGLAVIGTRSPGVEQVIQDGENGLLAESSAGGIAAAIRRLLDDPALARKVGENARAFVTRRYSQQEVVRREAEALRSLLR